MYTGVSSFWGTGWGGSNKYSHESTFWEEAKTYDESGGFQGVADYLLVSIGMAKIE